MNASGVAVDAAGNVYIADSGNCRVRKVSNGIITISRWFWPTDSRVAADQELRSPIFDPLG